LLGELPKLFGRDFLVGYFLPSATFLAAALVVMHTFDCTIPLSLHPETLLRDATMFGVASWIFGLVVLAANRNVLRLMEGYGKWNPLRLYGWVERRRFAKLRLDISELDLEQKSRSERGEELPGDLQRRLIALNERAAKRFPDEYAWLLPTALGNTIRAFEVYARLTYGLDAIIGWNRMLAVIPKDYRELVDTAKAQMDFWANLSFLNILSTVQYFAFAYNRHELRQFWLVAIILALCCFSYLMAIGAAVEWGDLVKAAFDVFLSELRQKLGFPLPEGNEADRRLWTGFSQAVLYSNPRVMPERVHQEGTGSRDNVAERLD
jgi:hypothetical protein